MSVRMRHTRGHTGNRRSHHALDETKAVKDSASGNLRLPHRVDETTGMYRGKQIAPLKEKRASAPKAKSPSAESAASAHAHEHAHAEHVNAEAKAPKKGLLGRITGGGRPKARSGMGGQSS